MRSLVALLALIFISAQAEPLKVAVASNFAAPMLAIADEFEKQSGYPVSLAFGASGKFVAQITHGAPFHLFFSADQSKPQALLDAGIAQAGSQQTYAIGKLVLWSPGQDPQQGNILNGPYRKLALANPRLAPYGSAAVSVLTQLNLLQSSKARWVQGENIAQTYQFVQSGNAELGFVALSQLMHNGALDTQHTWLVPSHLYPPIYQDRVVIRNAHERADTQAFLTFLQSPYAAQIIRSFGYVLPGQDQ
ncbi:molybdate ABC transporter substrate-binding protein [Bowmanella denitrificans]|uniref:Molybdate ABC transporter substrate-binding protein n=1 Tax=Bowmanella denitrificans TaxID=366582 RepID=A0ABN0WSM6_9ALTE